MKIKWNGHASFTITTSAGVKIITDPYEPGGFGGGIKYEPIPDQADIALVSHEHADHNYVQGLKGKPVVVRDSKEVKGIKFEAIPSFHDTSKGAERGRNNLFCFDADGIRVAHLGDLGHILDDVQIKKLGKVDVLLTPVGGFFTIDAKQSAELVRKINPRIVIPMHFKTDKVDFPIQPVDGFLNLFTKVKKLDKSEVEISKASLPASTEVWVLQFVS